MKVKEFFIAKMVEMLLSALSPAQVQLFARDVIKRVKKAVQDSESTLDDRIAMPLIEMIEKAFSLNDELEFDPPPQRSKSNETKV